MAADKGELRVGFVHHTKQIGSSDAAPAKTATHNLLGGPCNLVATFSWASDPAYNPPKSAYGGYPKYK